MRLVERLSDAQVEWARLEAGDQGGPRVVMSVFRDALKVDGVRRSATAAEMQEVADAMFCVMPTPRILDLIWEEAGRTGTRTNPVVNIGGKIVANLDDETVSAAVDAALEKAGGDKGGLMASVGKYWVLTNALRRSNLRFGNRTACNYGWHSTGAPYRAVTPGLKVWQSPGLRHNDEHVDPSQVVRLVYRNAMVSEDGSELRRMDMLEVLQHPVLNKLVSHEGSLGYLRQASVKEPLGEKDGDAWTLPETVIIGDPEGPLS